MKPPKTKENMRPLNPKTNKFQKKFKNDQNLYVIFMGMLNFLGLSLDSMKAFSHACLPLPNFFG